MCTDNLPSQGWNPTHGVVTYDPQPASQAQIIDFTTMDDQCNVANLNQRQNRLRSLRKPRFYILKNPTIYFGALDQRPR